MFGGPEAAPAKPSSRVLKPPGGGSSNLFGSPEEISSSTRTHRMASNIFGSTDEPQNVPKRTNPPGGKESGIFEEHKPNSFRHLTNPPGGKTSDIFGSPQPASVVKAHPNKPKDAAHTPLEQLHQHGKIDEDLAPSHDHIVLQDRGDVPPEPTQKAPEDQRQKVEVTSEREPQKITKEPELKISDHEPRLGPRPRSHNKVLNPPGGKSSIAFY